MVVDTRKRDYTMFHAPQTLGAEYLKVGFHGHFKTARYLPVMAKAMADFINADIAKGSFIILEMKRGTRQLGARQISAYWWMPATAGELYILPLERGVEQGRIHVHEDIETLPELIKVARPIEITYLNQELVEGLLGNNGKYVLGQVLKVVKDIALETDWPLDRVEIRYVRDPEVEDWEYVLLLLVFACDFETADRHLNELYNEIGVLTGKLSDEEQEALRRMIFFDIETKASISST
jgi:hypothetical protein